MLCKVCNTRLVEGAPACPNCGKVTTPMRRKSDRSDDGAASSTSPPAPLQESVHSESQLAETAELELEEPAEPDEGGAGVDEERPVVAAREQSQTTSPMVATDPEGLRELLAKEPELLERGLSILTGEGGKPIGACYATGVGDIDLLARDASGGLVVVMVSERDQGEELVAEVLQRIGWVRKHVGKGKQKVRGIVLVGKPPANLSYTAAAVADTVAFKTYRVALTFDDLEL